MNTFKFSSRGDNTKLNSTCLTFVAEDTLFIERFFPGEYRVDSITDTVVKLYYPNNNFDEDPVVYVSPAIRNFCSDAPFAYEEREVHMSKKRFKNFIICI